MLISAILLLLPFQGMAQFWGCDFCPAYAPPVVYPPAVYQPTVVEPLMDIYQAPQTAIYSTPRQLTSYRLITVPDSAEEGERYEVRVVTDRGQHVQEPNTLESEGGYDPYPSRSRQNQGRQRSLAPFRSGKILNAQRVPDDSYYRAAEVKNAPSSRGGASYVYGREGSHRAGPGDAYSMQGLSDAAFAEQPTAPSVHFLPNKEKSPPVEEQESTSTSTGHHKISEHAEPPDTSAEFIPIGKDEDHSSRRPLTKLRVHF